MKAVLGYTAAVERFETEISQSEVPDFFSKLTFHMNKTFKN